MDINELTSCCMRLLPRATT